MPEVLRFVNFAAPPGGVPTQTVFLKERWSEPWAAVPELWCSERTWAMAPSLSTATLRYRYGEVLEIGGREITRRFSLNNRLRFFVRVVDTTLPINASDAAGTRSWYGIIDSELDEQLGPLLAPGQDGLAAHAKGRNHLLAYGLESILAQSWILTSQVATASGETTVQRALTFNAGLAAYNTDVGELTGEGNMSTALGERSTHLFHAERSGGDVWSTKDIVAYLLAYCTATNSNAERTVPFALADADGALPSWDAPVLAAERLSVFEALNVLISRHRGLAWRVEVAAGAANQPDEVTVVPCTFLTSNLVLGEGRTLARNPRQVTIACEQDRGAVLAVKRSSLDGCDQVIVRGERRTSTATFCFADGTLIKGWSEALETAYEEGASSSAEYPAGGEVGSRELLNMLCRSADKFQPVFARFTLPDPFGGYVGDGTGLANQVLMPSDANADDPEPLAADDQRFLPQLALLEGFEYQDDAIDSGNILQFGAKPLRYQQPIVVFPRTTPELADRYRHADKSGLIAANAAAVTNNDMVSCQVRVDHDDGALWVEVGQGLNLLIARTDFSPLPDDQIDPIPADYRDMLATLSVAWSAFAEARYPAELAGSGHDVARQLVLYVPHHRCDYVVPETVVGLNEQTGVLLKTSTGGFIRDDRPALARIAEMAFAWYGTTRKSLGFGTSLVNSRLNLGDLVISLGDPDLEGDAVTEDINSVVTLVRIVSPLAEGQGDVRPPVPRIEYETAFGELDVLQFVPRMTQR